MQASSKTKQCKRRTAPAFSGVRSSCVMPDRKARCSASVASASARARTVASATLERRWACAARPRSNATPTHSAVSCKSRGAGGSPPAGVCTHSPPMVSTPKPRSVSDTAPAPAASNAHIAAQPSNCALPSSHSSLASMKPPQQSACASAAGTQPAREQPRATAPNNAAPACSRGERAARRSRRSRDPGEPDPNEGSPADHSANATLQPFGSASAKKSAAAASTASGSLSSCASCRCRPCTRRSLRSSRRAARRL